MCVHTLRVRERVCVCVYVRAVKGVKGRKGECGRGVGGWGGGETVMVMANGKKTKPKKKNIYIFIEFKSFRTIQKISGLSPINGLLWFYLKEFLKDFIQNTSQHTPPLTQTRGKKKTKPEYRGKKERKENERPPPSQPQIQARAVERMRTWRSIILFMPLHPSLPRLTLPCSSDTRLQQLLVLLICFFFLFFKNRIYFYIIIIYLFFQNDEWRRNA